jgi:hypothetical protein
MSLSFVLHVLDFAINFISIAHMTHDLNGRVTFYSHYCFFQDLIMRRMIGSGSDVGRLIGEIKNSRRRRRNRKKERKREESQRRGRK